MDLPEFAILVGVIVTMLVALIWLGRQLSTAKKGIEQASEAIKLTEESIALSREQLALQNEANMLMRELISALRNAR